MNKLSNKFLFVLVLIVVVVYSFGIWILVKDIQQTKITGYATNVSTQIGDVGVVVKGDLVITLYVNEINLGLLGLNDNNNSELANDFFEMRNDGSVDIDIKAYVDNNNHLWDTDNSPTDRFQIHCNSTTDSLTPALCNITYGKLFLDSDNASYIIQNLGNSNGANTCKAGINVTVPSLEDAGLKNASIIFFATQS